MATRFRQTSVLYPPESVGGDVSRQQFVSSTAALGWLHTLRFWISRRRRRKCGELTDLTNYLLRDIGVPQDDASHEVTKLFRR